MLRIELSPRVEFEDDSVRRHLLLLKCGRQDRLRTFLYSASKQAIAIVQIDG